MELLPNPIEQLRAWYVDAEALGQADVVALATANADATPSVRMVNFKGWYGDSVSFFSNYESQKGRDLAANPSASMLFYWPALKRQVQVQGACTRMDAEQSRAYFDMRDREAQLSAWMSRQSSELTSFEVMEQRVEELRSAYSGGRIPCPPYWGGYLLTAARIEFRIAREHRRHYRWEFVRTASGWQQRKLFP